MHCSPCLLVSFLQGPALFGCYFPLSLTYLNARKTERAVFSAGDATRSSHFALILPQPCDGGVKDSSSTALLLLSLSLPTPPSGPTRTPGSLTPHTPRGWDEAAPQPAPGPPAPLPPESARLSPAPPPPPPPHHLPRAAAAASACGFRLHAPRNRGAPA